MIVHILDFLSAGLTLWALGNISRDPRWWLMYGIGLGIFIGLMVHKGLLGQAIFGIVLFLMSCYIVWLARHLFHKSMKKETK